MKLFSFFLFLALLGLCLAAPTEEVAAVGEELQANLGTDLTENADHEVMDAAERLEDVTDIDSAERLEDVTDVDEVQGKEDVSLELSDKGYCKYFYYYCYRLKCKKFRKKYGYGHGYGYKPKKKCYKKFFIRRYKPHCRKCYCVKKCKY